MYWYSFIDYNNKPKKENFKIHENEKLNKVMGRE